MSTELMNTKEVADYLDIHEKQVYLLIKASRIPCSRVTGKWIFPKKLIDEWIELNAREGLKQARQKSKKITGALLAAGSNDPLLDMFLTATKTTHPDFYIFLANTGSVSGLKALNDGYTDIAFSHLFDPESGEYNIPYLASYLPHLNPLVVNLFYRDLGFIFRPETGKKIKDFQSLAKNKISIINRQAGSGTRVLLDYNLDKLGIPPEKIKGYEKEVFTHIEVGQAVLSGEADTGIASIAIARLLGLSFQAIAKERFDMILDKDTYFQPGIQSFIETLNTGAFRERVEKIGGYDFQHSGKFIYSTN